MKLILACLSLFLLSACATDPSKVAATGPAMTNAGFDNMEARLFAGQREEQKERERMNALAESDRNLVPRSDKQTTQR